MTTQTVNVTMSGSRKRRIKDKLASVSVTAGGILVLVALLLIFFYLLYVVKPIFESATITSHSELTLPVKGKTALLGVNDQNQIGYRFSHEGNVDFFSGQCLWLSGGFLHQAGDVARGCYHHCW